MLRETQRKYLFICGCARSGTSALWRLMTAHSKLAIGLERYIGRCNQKDFSMSPKHFVKDRFYTLKVGDTHFPSIEEGKGSEYYSEIKNRYEESIFFGDKTPKLFRYYEQLFKVFPNTKILFIYRNIFDVAQSFNLKKEKTGPWKRDYKTAVKDWNISLRETNQWLQKRENQILPICYEDLFFGKYFLENIFDFLEVECEELVQYRFKELREEASEIERVRTDKLSSLEKKYIMQNARFNMYKKLIEFDKQ